MQQSVGHNVPPTSLYIAKPWEAVRRIQISKGETSLHSRSIIADGAEDSAIRDRSIEVLPQSDLIEYASAPARYAPVQIL